jgi:Rieske 2Fe-2S family protein
MLTSSPSLGGQPCSLPGPYYTSPEVYEQELSDLFFDSWVYAGHESQIADRGDFFTTRLLGESVIVVRDHQGTMRAHYDVCRHRGSQLCGEVERGHAERFTCPYHQWTYDLDGRLIAAPRMAADFDRSAYGLKSIHVESWNGFVYANLAAGPVDSLDQHLYSSQPWQLHPSQAVADFQIAQAKIAHSITYAIRANWKLVVENFLECYHCAGAHPELCKVFDLGRYYRSYGPDDAMPAESVSYPLRAGAKTLSGDGDYVCRRLLTEREPRSGEVPHVSTMIGLNSALQLWPDYAVVFAFEPRGAGHSAVRVDWLVHRDSQVGRDYDVSELIELWDQTNRQDWKLCEINHAGVSSRAYEPGPHSLTGEPAIAAFLERYLDLMGAAATRAGAGG